MTSHMLRRTTSDHLKPQNYEGMSKRGGGEWGRNKCFQPHLLHEYILQSDYSLIITLFNSKWGLIVQYTFKCLRFLKTRKCRYSTKNRLSFMMLIDLNPCK